MDDKKGIKKINKKHIKSIPYGRQWLDGNDIVEVCKVLKSDWITQGPKIKEFENAVCEYTGARYAVAVSSGTAALHISCLAAGIEYGDEVITSPITFVASANAVLYCRAKPVFADIKKDTINIDPEEINKKITDKTKAIIPVHFAGHPCDLEEIYKIAKKHNIIIIEDAAHALGAEYKKNKIGSCKYSDMTTLSFHPVKHITTGEGGMVLTNRKDLYEKLLMYRNHGITKDTKKLKKNVGPWYYEQQLLGFNYRITDFQSILGLSQLKKLDGFIKLRREIVDIYRQKLSSLHGFHLPEEKRQIKSSWHIYCIRLKNRSKRKIIFEKLRQAGIGVQVHYIPVYLQPYYQGLGCYQKGLCPNAEDFYSRVITIPLYQSMKNEEVKYVVDTIYRMFSGK